MIHFTPDHIAIVDELETQGIISSELAQRILDQRDINAIDSHCETILHHVVEHGELAHLEQLTALGACHVMGLIGSAFIFAVAFGRIDMIEHFLATWPDEHLIALNSIGRNALHIATRAGKLDVLKRLLLDPRLKKRISQKDHFGKTACTIALHESRDDFIKLLADKPFETMRESVEYDLLFKLKLFFDKYQDTFPSSLIKRILDTGDINVIDEEGNTVLHYVVDYDDVELAQQLVAFGARHQFICKESALIRAVADGRMEVVRYFLSIWSVEEILAADAWGSNIFHTAIAEGRIDALRLFCSDARLTAGQEAKNRFNHTPSDVAQVVHAYEAIAALGLKPATAGINEPYFSRHQNVLNSKLSCYLQLKGRNPLTILYHHGMCNGWSFLFLIYASSEQDALFDEMLRFVSSWDGEEASLAETNQTLSALGWETRAAFFDELISVLALAQSHSKVYYELGLSGWVQFSRQLQYQLIRDPSKHRTLTRTFEIQERFTREQLIELMYFCQQTPGLCIDIGIDRHATSFYVTQAGQFNFFDSGTSNKCVPFNTAEQFADFLMQTLAQSRGVFRQQSAWFHFSAFRIEKAALKATTAQTTKQFVIPAVSANGFSPLHYAVLTNNLAEIKTTLDKNPNALFMRDAHGRTPIAMAFRMINIDCLMLFYRTAKAADLILPTLASEIHFSELDAWDDDDIQSLFEAELLKSDDKDISGDHLLFSSAVLRNSKRFRDLISDPGLDINMQLSNSASGQTLLACALRFQVDAQSLQMMLSRKDLKLGQTFASGINAIMIAFEFYPNDELLIKMLGRSDWDVNQKCNKGKTALHYAIENYVSVPVLKKLLSKQGIAVNHLDDKGQTPLMSAIANGCHIDLIHALLAHPNINIDLSNRFGETALKLAQNYHRKDIEDAIVHKKVSMRKQFTKSYDNLLARKPLRTERNENLLPNRSSIDVMC